MSEQNQIPEAKTSTQEQLNEIIAKRIREEQERVHKSYGLTPDEAAALREKEEKRRHSKLTEQQKIQERSRSWLRSWRRKSGRRQAWRHS